MKLLQKVLTWSMINSPLDSLIILGIGGFKYMNHSKLNSFSLASLPISTGIS